MYDQCCKGDTSSQWERAKLLLSRNPHPLTDNRQILHTWLRPPYLPTCYIWSKSRQGLLLPNLILFLYFFLCMQNLSMDLTLWPLNRFWYATHQLMRIRTQGIASRGLEHSIFTSSPWVPQNTHFGVHIIVSLWQIHNFTMYRATMLKFGKQFDLAKYLGYTQKFQCMGCSRGLVLVVPHLILGPTFCLRK